MSFFETDDGSQAWWSPDSDELLSSPKPVATESAVSSSDNSPEAKTRKDAPTGKEADRAELDQREWEETVEIELVDLTSPELQRNTPAMTTGTSRRRIFGDQVAPKPPLTPRESPSSAIEVIDLVSPEPEESKAALASTSTEHEASNDQLIPEPQITSKASAIETPSSEATTTCKHSSNPWLQLFQPASTSKATSAAARDRTPFEPSAEECPTVICSPIVPIQSIVLLQP